MTNRYGSGSASMRRISVPGWPDLTCILFQPNGSQFGRSIPLTKVRSCQDQINAILTVMYFHQSAQTSAGHVGCDITKVSNFAVK